MKCLHVTVCFFLFAAFAVHAGQSALAEPRTEIYDQCATIKQYLKQEFPELLDTKNQVHRLNKQKVFLATREQGISIEPTADTVSTLKSSFECAGVLLGFEILWVANVEENNTFLVLNQRKYGSKSGHIAVYYVNGYPNPNRWKYIESKNEYVFEDVVLDKSRIAQSYIQFEKRKKSFQQTQVQTRLHYTESRNKTYCRIKVDIVFNPILLRTVTNIVFLNSIFNAVLRPEYSNEINAAFPVDKVRMY